MNNKLEKTYNYLGFLICLSIPFMTYAKAFVNICMICLFLILVVLPNKQKALEIIKNNFFKTFLIFLLFVTLFTNKKGKEFGVNGEINTPRSIT